MNIEECINSAKSSLDRAKRELDSGHSLNWIPEELSSALSWVMEAWLLAHGHKINSCQRLNDYMAFTGQAPEELASGFRHCWAGASTLEFLLYGDSSDPVKLPTMEEWEARADVCVTECEKIVAAIILDTRGSEGSTTCARSRKGRHQ